MPEESKSLATPKIELFATLSNAFQPLTVIGSSILDTAGILDTSLYLVNKFL